MTLAREISVSLLLVFFLTGFCLILHDFAKNEIERMEKLDILCAPERNIPIGNMTMTCYKYLKNEPI